MEPKIPEVEEGERSRNHPDLENPDSDDKGKECCRASGHALPAQDTAEGFEVGWGNTSASN